MSGITRFFIKLIILAGLACFALVNYRCLSLDKGWSVVSINNKESITAVSLIESIPTKIEYYKKPFSDDEYKVYIETNGDNYLFDATEKDLLVLDVLGVFAPNIKPQKITPIPFYVELILGLIIIFLPFGRRNN